MKKFLALLAILLLSANTCFAAADEDLNSKEAVAETKYEADSEACYDSSEKKFNADKNNQSLSDDQVSEKLDELFNSCMAKKGHKVDQADKKEGTAEE